MSKAIDFLIDVISTNFNRSISQEKELLILCDMDYEKLVTLEYEIKENNITYSPSTLKEVEALLNQKP